MSDPEQTAGQLATLAKVQTGTAAADRAVIDALIVTLLKSLPTLAGPLLETLEPCQSHHGKGLEPESLAVFKVTMEHYKGLIAAVREC